MVTRSVGRDVRPIGELEPLVMTVLSGKWFKRLVLEAEMKDKMK